MFTYKYYEVLNSFEIDYAHLCLEREPQEYWKYQVYENDHVNELFFAYRRGYALGRGIGHEQIEPHPANRSDTCRS